MLLIIFMVICKSMLRFNAAAQCRMHLNDLFTLIHAVISTELSEQNRGFVWLVVSSHPVCHALMPTSPKR